MADHAVEAKTAPAPRRRLQLVLFGTALVLLVAGTTAGFVTARQDALDARERRAAAAATRTATTIESEIDGLVTSLGGAGAVVGADGALDLEVFSAFATDVLSLGRLPAVGLVAVGDDASYPLVALETTTDGASAVGLDYAADPDRAALIRTALETGAPAISDPVTLAVSGARALLIARPVTAAGGSEVVGFVVTNLPLADIDDAAARAAGDDMAVSLLDGETPLLGDEVDERDEVWTEPVRADDQMWTVAVVPRQDADLRTAWLVAGGGALATLAMASLWFVTARYQRSLARRNAELARNEARDRALQEVTGRLARSLSSEEIARALVQHLPVAVGADNVRLVVEDDNGAYQLFDDTSPTAHPLDIGGSTIEEVVTSNEPAWLSSPLAWKEDPATAEVAAGGSAMAVLPVRTRLVRGALAASFGQVHIFSDQEKALLETLGLLTGRALARGRRYDVARDAALAFQRGALPDRLPDIPGLDVAARYRPAIRQATVGGDWYDVLELDGGRIALVVGDVVGHGIEAAATMGRLRTACQVLASMHTDPGEMLRALGEQVAVIPNAFCTTIVCVVVDPADGVIRWSRSGHLPPFLLGTDGPELLEAPGGPPLGMVGDAPPVHTRPLRAGETLVLFTDGVVERRDEDLDVGFARLSSVAASLGELPLEQFGDALVEAMVPPESQADDLAVLAVRLAGATSAAAGPPPLDLTLPTELSSPGRARHALDAWLAGLGVHGEPAEELAVVVSELVANAVGSSPGGPISFRSRLDAEDRVVIEVRNDVPDDGGQLGSWDLNDPLRGGGRGLVLVRTFVDSLDVEREGNVLLVRARRSLASRPAAESSGADR